MTIEDKITLDDELHNLLKLANKERDDNFAVKQAIKALISQLENEVRIDELHNLAKKQKTFVGYGYDDIGVDINDIDDRIATLQAKEQE